MSHASSSSAAWPMPPLLRASLGLHAVAAGAAIAVPGAAPWAFGSVLANHAALTAAGLWPRSRLLGPNVTRLPDAGAARGEIALTIDDGPDPAVTPAVLDLLDRHGAKASFFCIAARAATQPALTREILARGHCVQNHSHVHRHNFAMLGPRGYAAELERAQQVLGDITGRRPHCFRAPAGLRNPFLDPVLHRLGLHLVSWTRRGFDTRERTPQRVLERLTRDLAAGDILLLHDGHAATTAAGRPVLLEVLPPLLDRCRAAGLRCVTLTAALPPRRTASDA
ncbi:polysaccharide deacetylase family protein [Methylibium sp. Pch-M]|uniref:polysaccharide deacetylase family protein n=1 Tax=Methylibium sp. Pch-M TaxID=2082386 RepID=UPI0010121F27|nr:polysaccharide deacetylase family protein [Methylibium sp. Pch-M]QAZ38225.1 polysaccharide deacetylase family protein [Methylibium sp. Pch-M]